MKSKHAEILDNNHELILVLKEKDAPMRIIELQVRVFNDGVAFRFWLPRAERVGERKITRELTTFSIPDEPGAQC